MKPYKIAAEKLTQLCWKTEQAAFDLALSLLKENATSPVGPSTIKPNGFIGQNQPAGPGTVNLLKTCC